MGFRFTNGPIRFGRRRFFGTPYAPRLKVKGYLFIDNKRIRFRGLGYTDHGWQNLMPHHVARRWYAARAFDDAYTIIAIHLLTPRKWKPNSVPGLSIARGERWIIRADHRHMRFAARHRYKDKTSGYKVPMLIIYRGKQNGWKFKLKIEHLKLFDKMDVLSQFNPVLRFLIQKLISKPYIFRFRARFTLTLQHGSKREKRTLMGYTEWAFLNP